MKKKAKERGVHHREMIDAAKAKAENKGLAPKIISRVF